MHELSAAPDPDLSVLIVTHNGCDEAVEGMRSARTAAGDARLQWVVVDCGSTDGTPDAVESAFVDVAVHRRENLGFAGGVNEGLPHCRGRYVLLLNPDVRFARGSLSDLVAALDERPEVGAASVVQVWPDGRIQPSMRRYPTAGRQLADSLLPDRLRAGRLGERETRASRYADERAADWLVGAFLALRREALEQVGPLDTRFFLYSEETDLCYRMRRAGWDVRHLPHLTIIHDCDGYPRPELAAQLSRSKLLYADKHLPPARRVALRAALIAGHALRMVLLTGRRGERRRGERAALAVAARGATTGQAL